MDFHWKKNFTILLVNKQIEMFKHLIKQKPLWKKYSKNFIQNKSKGALWDTHPEKSIVDSMIRVDHAGEFGACIICKGQLSILNNDSTILEIHEQEKEHLEKFNQLINEKRVRPTVLQPIWKVGGFLLGASTSLLGRESAMACHKAVETVISEHYEDQLRKIHHLERTSKDMDLRSSIRKFRDDEIHHHDLSVEQKAEEAPGYNILYESIKMTCNVAIWISKRF